MIPSVHSYNQLFLYYQQLGYKALGQLTAEDQYFWAPGPKSNSIAVTVQHLYGNMLSRWTDFLTSDGEKESRNREQEFELYVKSSSEVMTLWEQGWTCLFAALETITEENKVQLVYIRSKGHTIDEALQRQLAHYAYHVGQLVFISRMLCKEDWKSLSIPKGQSRAYNQRATAEGKRKEHFTENLMDK